MIKKVIFKVLKDGKQKGKDKKIRGNIKEVYYLNYKSFRNKEYRKLLKK